jgi:hypothetical protein
MNDDRDDLDCAKGVVFGIIMGAPIWIAATIGGYYLVELIKVWQ